MTAENHTSEELDDDSLHYVLPVDDVPEEGRALVDVQGLEIAIFNKAGEFYGMGNTCVHQGGPVSEGPIRGTIGIDDCGNLTYDRDGELVACPWHGYEFDLETGEHSAHSHYKMPTYDIEVHDNKLYVKL